MAGSAAPEVSSVDETYPGASDGKITGLTAGLVYEISSDNGVTWEDAVLTGTEIHNLRAVLIRFGLRNRRTAWQGR